ncbi:F-box protein At5g50450-like [Diospyros lotus]|uniref:F-box protein At5g50450-like n=1 Tax=Diospyros lotus TaxID=55363 RepID=UPI0022514FFA|nr:F-box protein At5g50450-like [Diospyros lotus]
MFQRKEPRSLRERSESSDLFDGLPDDIVISILAKLSFSACSPSDFVSVLLTCKRLNRLGFHPLVLSVAGPEALAIRAGNWSHHAHRFLQQCVNAGNIEALYTLGMIRFYCLQNRGSGLSLMAKAAIRSHAPALYSLAVIQFNGSGRSKTGKDLRAGVALCARAADLGYNDALRELGHCLQDGYGVRQNVAGGRRFLFQANARELACLLRAVEPAAHPSLTWQPQDDSQRSGAPEGSPPGLGLSVEVPLLRYFGCDVSARVAHPVNRFLRDWFGLRPGNEGLRMCSHSGCGRPETRRSEFRRCSACGTANYCSRGCQAQDWKLRHKAECTPMNEWFNRDGGDDGADADDNPMAVIEEAAFGGADG